MPRGSRRRTHGAPRTPAALRPAGSRPPRPAPTGGQRVCRHGGGVAPPGRPARHPRAELALDARRPGAGPTPHTGRGGQYAAAAYRQALAARGIARPVRRARECPDDAMAERPVATPKAELVDAYRRPTRAGARTASAEWLAVFYNRQRSHSALAYRPPATFEAETLLRCSVA